MANCIRCLSRVSLSKGFTSHLMRSNSCYYYPRRQFHDYWTQKSPGGLSLRVPILKARHHLGALTSRGDRAENEDRFKVGLMNKLTTSVERQPFYFAIIDGYLTSPLWYRLIGVDTVVHSVQITSSTISTIILKMSSLQKPNLH